MSSVLRHPLKVIDECVAWSVERNIYIIQRGIDVEKELDMTFFDVEFDEGQPDIYPADGLGMSGFNTRVDLSRLDVFLAHVTALHGIELPRWNLDWNIYGEEAVVWLTSFWEQRNARLHFQGVSEFKSL